MSCIPQYAQTLTISATTAAGGVVTQFAVALKCGTQLEVTNNGTDIVYMQCGISTVQASSSATVGDYPVAPGQCKIWTPINVQTPANQLTHIAIIALTGTQQVLVTPLAQGE